MRKTIRILFMASEAEPFVKVGGLGDVAGSLPPALRALSPWHGNHLESWDIDIRLVIPYHGIIPDDGFNTKKLTSFSIPYKDRMLVADIYMIEMDSMPVYLISSPLFPPDAKVYSSDSKVDGLRYAFFSLSAIEMVHELGWKPHIVHANDWHTSTALLGLKTNKRWKRFFPNLKTILGIHNLSYMGDGAKEILSGFAIPRVVGSGLPIWAQNRFLPWGLYSADKIVTVSPTYAKEILTPEYGCGLEKYLKSRSNSLSGILNGIDMQLWNPEEDLHLANRYGCKNIEDRIENKKHLQRELGFIEDERIPLLGMVSRLDFQKGVDLIPESLRQLNIRPEYASSSWQFILLGTGNPDLEKAIIDLQFEFPERVRMEIRFDSALSHRVYAGADMLLIPSRFEPCGLTQMIAMRYGCVPVARSTGGLRDTIIDFKYGKSTGFLFNEPNSTDFTEAIGRALHAFMDKSSWIRIQERGMSIDFSWKRSAQEYLKLYISCIE